MGIGVTDVSTTQQLPLGFKYTEFADGTDMGEKTWVYIFNDGAASLTAGCAAFRDPSAANASDPAGLMYGAFIAAAATVYPAVSVIGVAQHTIAAGSYGFIQCKGKGLVLNGTANITADTPITTGGSGAGSCIDYADGATTRHAVIAFSLEAEATDNVTFDAYINCLGS